MFLFLFSFKKKKWNSGIWDSSGNMVEYKERVEGTEPPSWVSGLHEVRYSELSPESFPVAWLSSLLALRTEGGDYCS
jgi:hypothetical protein